MVKSIGELFGSFRKKQIGILVLIVFGISLDIFITFNIRNLIDAITEHKPWNDVMYAGMMLIVLTTFNVIFEIVQNYKWHAMRTGGVSYLRKIMFGFAIRKPASYVRKNGLGKVVATVMNDVEIPAQTSVIAFPMLFANVANLCFVMVALFFLSYQLAIITLITLPIYYLSFNRINGKIRKNSASERKSFSKVMGEVQEKLSGLSVIKVFQKEEYAENSFNKTVDEFQYNLNKILFLNAMGNGLTLVITQGLPIAILLFGGYLTYSGLITLGTLIAFYTFLSRLYEPIRNLSDWNLGNQRSKGIKDKLIDFMNETESESDGENKVKSINSIEFENVSFGYEKGKNIIENFSMILERGDRLAILGESGQGKSTILNLILKFYEVGNGRISVNGIDVKKLNKSDYYKHISILQQEPFLFTSTIEENITFGDKPVHYSAREVAEICRLNSLINKFPEGMNRELQENGFNVSGGEKQRICLARALFKGCDLLLLDEATSALDRKTEEEFIRSLEEYLEKNNTILVAVTHKKKILDICNKVIELDKDKTVIELGE